MASAWDRRPVGQWRAAQDRAVAAQFAERIRPFSPYWRSALSSLGLGPGAITTVAALAGLPAVTERDVCLGGNPALAAGLVLQADEAGFARHAPGADVRGALARRFIRPQVYRRQIEAAYKPVSYTLGGLGMVLPVASTRADLQLQARAGARAWAVLGLRRDDVLVSAIPHGPTLEHEGVVRTALGAGAAAVHAGADLDLLVAVLATVPATVLALPLQGLTSVLEVLGGRTGHVRTVVVVGGSAGPVREQVRAVLGNAVAVAGLWGPPDARVLWAETDSGFVTYPDLEVLQLVDPATGEEAAADEGGELVVTQLGFAGTALVRWRTGAVCDTPLRMDLDTDGRTVPRLPTTLRPGALVVPVTLGTGPSAGAARVDLRAVAGVVAARGDLSGWRVELGRGRDGDRLLVHITPTAAGGEVAARVARDIEATCGLAPTQVVVSPDAGRPVAVQQRGRLGAHLIDTR